MLDKRLYNKIFSSEQLLWLNEMLIKYYLTSRGVHLSLSFFFSQDATLDNQTLVSPVLSSSVANLSISNLSENIQFTIQNIKPINVSKHAWNNHYFSHEPIHLDKESHITKILQVIANFI